MTQANGIMTRMDLTVQGMTCQSCAGHIEQALREVSGVETVSVSHTAGRGTVETSGHVTPAQLVEAIEGAGYHASVAADDEAPRESHAALTTPEGRSLLDTDGRQGGYGGRQASDFDILVIGTGGAGVAAAIQAGSAGARVGIAEGTLVGGTCVNVGCIPSKNLIEAAAHYHAARTGFPGIAPCEPALDWTSVLRQKHDLVGELRQAKYLDVLASYPSITLLDGRVSLTGAGAGGGPVTARLGEGGGARDIRAAKVIIATGTSPALPSIPGLDQADALDSTTVMELQQLPVSMLVLGGGPVGVEAAQTFSRFGVKVMLVQRGQRLLPGEEPVVSDALRAALESEGIEVLTGTTATRVERIGAEAVMHVTQGSLAGQLRAERVLIAAGRRPNTTSMGLEQAGVRLTSRGYVEVDSTMRSTTHPHVYAAGDVTGGPGYVYVAAAGGRIAAENAVNALADAPADGAPPARELDLSVVPSVTFTAPQVASVGLTESGAREAGYEVKVSVLDMAQVPRALVSHHTAGLVKIVAEAESGRLLGVHALAMNAGDFIGEAALAIRFGLTAQDLTGTLHPYLTWGEALKLASQGFSSDVTKLSCCA